MKPYLAGLAFTAALLAASSALAAGITYDCQAHISRVETPPPPAPDDPNAWQCKIPVSPHLPNGTHWQRSSLEYCRIAVNTYDEALAAAHRIARTHRRGSWIVIMDADETVLDNSLFDRERDRCGSEYRDAQWQEWVQADLAGTVPGAAAFTHAVHALGGLVAIVTNRRASDDVITQRTLRRNGIWFDSEIGMADTEDKTVRWQSVSSALAARFGRRARPVMWVGDQVTDFPILDARGDIVRAMSQKDAGEGIGTRFFLLPDPMYGNWQKNPEN